MTILDDAGAEPRPAHRRPVILMTPDLRPAPVARSESEYAVRANYAAAIAEAGGLALILPYAAAAVSAALDLADGVLVTGSLPGVEVERERSAFERELVRLALARSKPLLGICHGMQLIGECLGGTVAREMPARAGESVAHRPGPVPDRPAHAIDIAPESLLARLAGAGRAEVNSLHGHALTGPGRFRPAARAPDGVLEAFEGDTPGFCLGVQWHPEYGLTPLDRAIFRDFVERCAGRTAEARPGAQPCAVRARLSRLSLELPEAPDPPGAFVGAVRTGDLVTVSGQVPLKGGAVLRTGRVGDTVSVEEGRECARWALLNALAQVERIAGGLESVQGFGRLAGYVAASPGFARHGAVIDGASELLRELFPDRWQHARIAVGVSSLPRDVPVEIELTARIGGAAPCGSR